MIHAHVMYEFGVDQKPHGSAHIRLLRPLLHPSVRDRIRITSGEQFAPADVVIVDRTWKYNASLHEVEKLIDDIRSSGSALVYSIDDNLLDLDLSGSFRTVFTLEQHAFIRLLARSADSILVSTPPLAERMQRLNPEVYLLPNALDETLFTGIADRPAKHHPLVVGYMGTFTHDDDLFMILESLRAHAGQIELHLVGGLSDMRFLDAFKPLAVKVLNTGGKHEYPDFTGWMCRNMTWDIGLAPLEDTAFTRCKSDIKFLDYSMLGIPGIFSRVPAYQNTIQHGVTGLLADNTPASWRDNITLLTADHDLRQTLRRQAAEWTRHNRTLAVCAGQWVDALEATLKNRKKGAAVA